MFNDVVFFIFCYVEVCEGEKVLVLIKVVILREDLLEVGIGNGCYGFILNFEMFFFLVEVREVYLYINGKCVIFVFICL